MSQPDIANARHGQERMCPQCGARVAQRARACFFCGTSLEDAPRHRLTIPWADITLFAVIGGLVVLWWLRPPSAPVRPRVSLSANQPSTVLAQQRIAGAQGAAGSTLPVILAREPVSVPKPGETIAQLVAAPTLAPPPTTTPATATPTATATETAPPPPAATPIIYKVRSGDSVPLIAERTNSTTKAIAEANNLSGKMMIYPGQELVIPAATGGQSSAPAPTPTPTGGTLIYRVAAGDTVSSIAARYGSSTEWILAANHMTAKDYLQAGQALMIPLSDTTPEPTATATPVPATTTPAANAPFRAPMPLGPSDDGLVAADSDAILSWASVGVLTEDEWYVVTLVGSDGKPAPMPPYWTKSTSWRLPRDYRGGTGGAAQAEGGVSAASVEQLPTPEAVQYTWQVQVVAGTPGKPGPALSEPSPARRFTWK